MQSRVLIGRTGVIGFSWLIMTLWSPGFASQVNTFAPPPGSVPLASDIGGPAGGANAGSASDAETQLREIENTQKLMKALGELHGKSGPASQQGQLSTVPAPPGASPAAQSGLEGRLDLPGVPSAELREVASGVSQAARALGVASSSNQSSGREGGVISSTHAGDSSQDSGRARPYGPQDEQRFKALLDQLVDEILPWALGFLVLFGFGYGSFAWISNRSTRPAKHKHPRSSRRSGSRRHSSQASEVRSSGRD